MKVGYGVKRFADGNLYQGNFELDEISG